jgi:guanosine-3',5'-bis(diphosphate) 3'-pyrophosphohydrolase
MNPFAVVFAAAQFAAEKHAGQTAKNGQPYINHPIEVAFLLADVGGIESPEVIAASLLHDVIEKCGVTRDELANLFGDTIANLVLELTDDKGLPEDERRRHQTAAAANLSPNAKLIRLADKISNLRQLLTVSDSASREPLKRYADWTSELLPKLAGVSPSLEALLSETLVAVREKTKIG